MPRLRPAPGEKEDQGNKPAVAETTPEIVVQPEAVEVEVSEPDLEPEPQQDDATLALKKQIEELRKSEQLQRERAEQFAREREEALERARQREAQIQHVQKEVYNSQAEAISSALAAAQAELAKAKMDIKNAIDLGDSEAQAEALQRQAIAASNLTRLQEGKDAAEARAKEAPTEPVVDPVDTWGMPDITTKWLKNHRHWLTDPVKLNKLRYFNDQTIEAGFTPHTQEFLEQLEVKMGERPEPEAHVDQKPEPKKGGPMVSAPVSRDVPNSNGKRQAPGKVTLTPREQEAARVAGISLEEYAKQKIRLAEMKASGEYGEQRS